MSEPLTERDRLYDFTFFLLQNLIDIIKMKFEDYDNTEIAYKYIQAYDETYRTPVLPESSVNEDWAHRKRLYRK
jgi:hypothetical protein